MELLEILEKRLVNEYEYLKDIKEEMQELAKTVKAENQSEKNGLSPVYVRENLYKYAKHLDNSFFYHKKEIKELERKIKLLKINGYLKSESLSEKSFFDIKEKCLKILKNRKNKEKMEVVQKWTYEENCDFLDECFLIFASSDFGSSRVKLLRELWESLEVETQKDYLDNFFVFEVWGDFVYTEIFKIKEEKIKKGSLAKKLEEKILEEEMLKDELKEIDALILKLKTKRVGIEEKLKKNNFNF